MRGYPTHQGTTKSPFPQKLNKGGEASAQNMIFDEKGNHIGDWVNDKKVMHSKKLASAKGKKGLVKPKFNEAVGDLSDKPLKQTEEKVKETRNSNSITRYRWKGKGDS